MTSARRAESPTPPGRVGVLLFCLAFAASCATTTGPSYVAPEVLGSEEFSTSRRPVVRVLPARGDAAEAILRAATPPDEAGPSNALEAVAMIPIAIGLSCAYALCLGGPVIWALDEAFLKAKVGPIAKALAAHAEGPTGPWGRQLEEAIQRRWRDDADLDPELTLTMTTVALLNAVSEQKVCVEAALQIALARGDDRIYENYLRVGTGLSGLRGLQARCDRVDALAADGALAVRKALDAYAAEVPGLLQQRLPGLPWR